MNTLAFEVSIPGFTFDVGSGPIGGILGLAIIVLWLIATIEGSTAIFRGLRDIITARRGDPKPNIIARLTAGLITFMAIVTGIAFFAGLAVWVNGTTFLFGRKPKRPADTPEPVRDTETPDSAGSSNGETDQR